MTMTTCAFISVSVGCFPRRLANLSMSQLLSYLRSGGALHCVLRALPSGALTMGPGAAHLARAMNSTSVLRLIAMIPRWKTDALGMYVSKPMPELPIERPRSCITDARWAAPPATVIIQTLHGLVTPSYSIHTSGYKALAWRRRSCHLKSSKPLPLTTHNPL